MTKLDLANIVGTAAVFGRTVDISAAIGRVLERSVDDVIAIVEVLALQGSTHLGQHVHAVRCNVHAARQIEVL